LLLSLSSSVFTLAGVSRFTWLAYTSCFVFSGKRQWIHSSFLNPTTIGSLWPSITGKARVLFPSPRFSFESLLNSLRGRPFLARRRSDLSAQLIYVPIACMAPCFCVSISRAFGVNSPGSSDPMLIFLSLPRSWSWNFAKFPEFLFGLGCCLVSIGWEDG